MGLEPVAWAVASAATAVASVLWKKVRNLERLMRVHRPEMIILMRHGESEANVDHTMYEKKGDPHVELTERGKRQAAEATTKMAQVIGTRAVAAFISPYARTRQTASIVLSGLHNEGIPVTMMREEPRLREREFCGSFQHGVPDTSEAESYSRFFWRPPGGESCADVYDRVSSFMESLWRIFARLPCIDGGAVVIVTHGLTLRIFAMRWLQWTPEMFLQTWNPDNAEFIVLRLQPPDSKGKTWYALTEDSMRALRLDPNSHHRAARRCCWSDGSDLISEHEAAQSPCRF